MIHIPIAHTPEDMGSLGRRLPSDVAYQRLVQVYWAETQQLVRALSIDWAKVKVYQDGLPDASTEIVRKILAEVNSPNYELLRWLAAQGADLIGTESPALLKEEYGHLQAVLAAKDESAGASARVAYAERAVALLAERDAYIAARIAETLPPGGTGLLFIGRAHRVAEKLPADISVRKLRRRRRATTPTNAGAV